MICEKIALNEAGTANLFTYCLDPDISYGVTKRWPAVVVVPGGGYLLTATKEGEAVAAQFLARGFSCFVLRYAPYLADREALAGGEVRTDEDAHYPAQELQLMCAMHIIHAHAAEWGIDAAAIFTCGFSAGSHISGTLATRWNDPELTSRLSFAPQGEELRPAGSILAYPMLHGNLRPYFERMKDVPGNIAFQAPLIERALYGHTNPTEEETAGLNLVNHVGEHVPPLFIWHSIDDPVVNPVDTTRFVCALQEAGVPCEYHLYGNGGHGLACANEHYAKSDAEISERIATWVPMASTWMHEIAEAR